MSFNEKEWWKLEEDELWIKCAFREDSYSIWLTDLCQLYAEELDGSEFRWRASKAKLPIDIDEAHNVSTLLKNLFESVKCGSFKASSLANRSRFMDLITAVQLPQPLLDTEWTFKLELQPDNQFRDRVSKPLLARIDTFQQREDDLIHRLHDKDHAIEKLLDTLAKYSVDLADVFPSLASHGTAHRNSSRRDAETHIPGLRSFDEQAWHDNMAKGMRYERPKFVERESDLGFEKQPERDKQQLYGDQEQKQDRLGPKPIKGKGEGIKLVLDAHKPNKEANVTLDTERDRETSSHSITPQAQKPKGIKRTLGSRNGGSGPELASVIKSSEAESKQPPTEELKGIKRTLTARAVHPRTQDSDSSISALAKDNVATQNPKDQPDDEQKELADDDDTADRKRAALKKQFAAAAHKPKKRKF